MNEYQLSIAKPGTPDSPIVGRSGNRSERTAEVLAMVRTLPLFMWLAAVDTVAKISCRLPPTRSVIAGPPPLYGTCCMRTPAIIENSSPARWSARPAPDEP